MVWNFGGPQPLRILEHAAPVFFYKLVVAEAGVWVLSGFVWLRRLPGVEAGLHQGMTFELSFFDVLRSQRELCDSGPSFPVVGQTWSLLISLGHGDCRCLAEREKATPPCQFYQCLGREMQACSDGASFWEWGPVSPLRGGGHPPG